MQLSDNTYSVKVVFYFGKDKAMKTCERCGIEIDTKDGENCCILCEDRPKRARGNKRATKLAMEQAMRDIGLTKCKGALGGVYWE